MPPGLILQHQELVENLELSDPPEHAFVGVEESVTVVTVPTAQLAPREEDVGILGV